MIQTQLGFYSPAAPADEDAQFLTQQLITYLGNKRALLPFIGQGLEQIRAKLQHQQLRVFDVFSGSGIVARYLKQYARTLVVNDVENYATVINRCYLTNATEVDWPALEDWYRYLKAHLTEAHLHSGFITELYAPHDADHIGIGERCFYTPRNARYLDTARQLIDEIPPPIQHFFLAPLLAEASVHANTSGIFKGFYKNSATGKGQFGGNKQDALPRILGPITIKKPLFSRFTSEVVIHQGDANHIAALVDEVDVAYLDPPYNQHPYGSNYFMLNLLVNYTRPTAISNVSGIPDNWYRSAYNQKQYADTAMRDLVDKIKAKYLLISFNSEGFITLENMLKLLADVGKTTVLTTRYNTFKGSRNLNHRDQHVKEYLYLVEKQ